MLYEYYIEIYAHLVSIKLNVPSFMKSIINLINLTEEREMKNLPGFSIRIEWCLKPTKISWLEICVDVNDLDLRARPPIDCNAVMAPKIALANSNAFGLVMN
jgi:hypothetical protein